MYLLICDGFGNPLKSIVRFVSQNGSAQIYSKIGPVAPSKFLIDSLQK